MRLTKLTMIAAVFALQSCSVAAPVEAQQQLKVRVISSPQSHLVSGGDALLEVLGASDAVELAVNGSPAPSPRFDLDRGTWVGLVTGLEAGSNMISARSGGATARLEVINHPKDGPILSGPHIWPYQCDTVTAGLGAAVDSMCNAETRTEHFYRTTGGAFKPVPTGARPTDLASVTLPDSRVVPYVVRVESGTINRSIYRIAILDGVDEQEGADWRPGSAWNRRLAVMFEGGLAGRYQQGFSPVMLILNDIYLSRGFAVMNASRLVNGMASNAVLQGETLMMLKEHFIEQYGIPSWTVGTGGSGGAIQQINITSLYPGLLDGIQAEASFADSQVATHVLDCDLMENYWSRAWQDNWSDEKKAATAGYASPMTCKLWTQYIAPNLKVSHKPACGLNDLSLVYDPETNPEGARCGMYSWLVNQLGRDPETGFPLSPWDNIGVQYGLTALNAGKISVDEFLDLNEGIGGFTDDGIYSPDRTAADPETMRKLYASGLVNSGGGGLDTTPVILSRKYGDPEGDFHDRQRDFEIRLRMTRANGDADNTVIWVGPPRPDPPFGAPKPLQIEVLDAMTRWLDAIEADPRPASHAKTVSLRPTDATDAWFDEDEIKHPEPATLDPSSDFNKAYPVHGNPRIAAGGPQTNDILKCQLKPVDLSDYEVTFNADQLRRLEQVFPTGVCDFGKPGVGQVEQSGMYVKY